PPARRTRGPSGRWPSTVRDASATTARGQDQEHGSAWTLPPGGTIQPTRQAERELVGHRSASPWDAEPRRPSHADKRRAWRRELLAEEIHAVLRPGVTEREMLAAAERLLNLAA